MKIFLYDNDNEYSYEKLLKDAKNTTYYCPYYRTEFLYNFFLNFIISLISNNNITLIDSDLTETELNNLSIRNVNLNIEINPLNLQSIDDLVERVKNSTSEITIFTSGTTGKPKEVIHNVESLTRTIRISEKYQEQIWGFAYNPTHMAGLQVFFQAFQNKNTLINLFNKPRSLIYQAINKYSITHISATPTFYRLLLPFENSYITLKRVTFGGEKSDQKLFDSIRQIFPNAKINNIYATTETGSLFATNGEFFHIPIEIFDKIKVVNDELLVHKSLLGRSDNLQFTDDYYCTGDIIEWHNKENGLFRFKNRKNELINVGGYKINPIEVESVFYQIPEVVQVVVFGKPNSILGNILCAELVLTNSSVLTEFEIRKFLSKELQDFKIPRIIKFVETISLTKTGKIKRI